MTTQKTLTIKDFANSDRYQYTESAVLLEAGKAEEWAIFEFFFRKTEDGAFAVVCGVESVVQLINSLNQSSVEEKRAVFSALISEKNLLEYLCNLQFKGNVYAMKEGDLCYPGESVIVVEGPLIVAKLLETPLLNAVNFQMAVASKASRVCRAAGDIGVASFGTRRAHGYHSAVLGTKASLIGGCQSHSNLIFELDYGIPSVGTMSHSYIQAFGVGKKAEKQAFDAFISSRKAEQKPLLLLIDTYNTLTNGLPNAILAFKQANVGNDYPFFGVRIDSGDLAYLSKMCRAELDKAGLTKAIIMLTNALDENSIKALIDQGASIDMIGVGDAIAVSRDNPCFGGVYKLASIEGKNVIKLSDDIAKCTTPAKKEIYRIYQQGEAVADLITLEQDVDKDKLLQRQEITLVSEQNPLSQTTLPANSYTIRSLLVPMILQGNPTKEALALSNVCASRTFCKQNITSFSPEHKRLLNPHRYKVDLSTDLLRLKKELIIEARSSRTD